MRTIFVLGAAIVASSWAVRLDEDHPGHQQVKEEKAEDAATQEPQGQKEQSTQGQQDQAAQGQLEEAAQNPDEQAAAPTAEPEGAVVEADEAEGELTTPSPKSESEDDKRKKYTGRHPSIAGWKAARESIQNNETARDAHNKAEEARKYADENGAEEPEPAVDEEPKVCPCSIYLKEGTMMPSELKRCMAEHKCEEPIEGVAGNCHGANALQQEEPEDSAETQDAPADQEEAAEQAAGSEEEEAKDAKEGQKEEPAQEGEAKQAKQGKEDDAAQEAEAEAEAVAEGSPEDQNPGEGYCLQGLDDWQTGWTHHKKLFCCEHFKKGCEPDKCPCAKLLTMGKIDEADYSGCVKVHHCVVHRGHGAKHIVSDEVDTDKDETAVLKRKDLSKAAADTAKVIAKVAHAASTAAMDSMTAHGGSKEAAKEAAKHAASEVAADPKKDELTPAMRRAMAAGGPKVEVEEPTEMAKAAKEVDEELANSVEKAKAAKGACKHSEDASEGKAEAEAEVEEAVTQKEAGAGSAEAAGSQSGSEQETDAGSASAAGSGEESAETDAQSAAGSEAGSGEESAEAAQEEGEAPAEDSQTSDAAEGQAAQAEGQEAAQA